MMWRRRRKVSNIFQLIRINDRVQIRIGRRSYFTRVEDIQDDEIHVAAPVERGLVVKLRQGMELTMNVFIGVGVRQFACSVKSMLCRRVTLVVLHCFEAKGVVQKRSYERVHDGLQVRYKKEDWPDDTVPWRWGMTCDISGGGLRIVAEDVWLFEVGGLVELDLMLPEDKSIRAIAQVVRVVDLPGASSKYLIALSFVEIDEADRRHLIDYVRNRLEELRKTSSSFVRCTGSVSIAYRKGRGDGTKWKYGRVYDMGSSGLRMIVRDASGLLTGQWLDVSVTLPGSVIIEAVGEVVWIRSAPEIRADVYEAGIKFVDVSDEGQEIILGFLSQVKHGVRRRFSLYGGREL